MNTAIVWSRRGVAALASALAVFGCLALAEPAKGGTYTVFQCSGSSTGSGNPADDPDVRRSVDGGGSYLVMNSCGSADSAIGVYNPHTAGGGSDRRWTWFAPSGTGIVRARMRTDLRQHQGYSGRVFTSHGDLLVAGSAPYGWRQRDWSFPDARSTIGVRLACGWGSGCDSGGSNQARAYLSNIALTVRDDAAPRASAGGPLVGSPGWQRGDKSLVFGGTDQGSGVSAYIVDVGGERLSGGFGQCWRTSGGYAARMRPCPLGASYTIDARTRRAPWRDGSNTVGVCAWDFSGNGKCRAYQVRIDNSPPAIQFRSAQDPADPELIRVRVDEPHSGVKAGKIAYAREGSGTWHQLPTAYRDGELRARVDSEAVPAGRYRFRAWAEDRAGNESGQIETRENGQPMVLSFPLRTGSELRASVGGARSLSIPYGRESKLAGRLRSADGDPLAFQKLTVSERFAAGALESQHVRQVVTERDGSFALRLPAGPSRQVEVEYPGSRRYRPATPRQLGLAVRSEASFRTSRRRVRPGRSVLFKGKVKHRGARLPRSGKLVELQVREGPRRWGTVREAFSTTPKGRYRLRYRFGRFYTRPVSFRFRVKITREQGWPYKAPVRTRARRVTVVP